MLRFQNNFLSLNNLIAFSFRTLKKKRTFRQRITLYNNKLDRYDRVFLIRPPNLQTKNVITFPIKIPMRVRHIYNPNKNKPAFKDNSQKIHWNRLSPNEILLAFQNIQYLEYNEMIEGLRFLSQIQGQQSHDWNTHAWVSKALNHVNDNFKRIKVKDYIPIYYLMKKLKYNNESFWKKVYEKIEDMIYELPTSQFQKFFLRYYKVCGLYFSSEMKDKFLTLMENRLRSFQPKSIIKIFQIYLQEERLDDYWKFNVFVPLFKSNQYPYSPEQLHKIFRFMLIINHEKDDRLYEVLYKRLMTFERLSLEEIDMFVEVLGEIKDLFISHRVDPYFDHLQGLKKLVKQENKTKKKEIPIHELVRQDLIYFFHRKKLQSQQTTEQTPSA